MNVCFFITGLIRLNNYFLHFPPDHLGQMTTALPENEVKQILYHAIPNTWRKKMTEQGHNYLDRSIQEM